MTTNNTKYGVKVLAIGEPDYNMMTTNLLDGSAKIEFLKKYLALQLCRVEGLFDSDPRQLSDEEYIEYIEAAQYMADNFGRKNHRIRLVKEWIDRLRF
jgi:hypothetical protein